MRRKNRRGIYLILLLALFIVLFISSRNAPSQAPASGNGSAPGLEKPAGNGSSPAAANTSAGTPGNESGANGPLRIASFNIQVFGESKRSKPEVMDVLSAVVREFDIVAVQELRDDTETTLPLFLEKINSLPGPRYEALIGPRLGRTSSKENYAYIYNAETVRPVAGSEFTFEDPPRTGDADLFQREPFIARFAPAASPSSGFALITIHTDPDTTPQELADLPLALDAARGRYPGEDDFVLLGDMNADCSYLSSEEKSSLQLANSTFTWAVPDSADTTVKATDCAYDRIILSGGATSRWNGTWGVFRFDLEYMLNQSSAEEVSDHYPVWVELLAG